MHFKDNRAIVGVAYAYELSGGGSGAKKIGGGDASAGGGRAGGGGAGPGAPGGGDGGGGGGTAGAEMEETLQDAILAEKVGDEKSVHAGEARQQTNDMFCANRKTA